MKFGLLDENSGDKEKHPDPGVLCFFQAFGQLISEVLFCLWVKLARDSFRRFEGRWFIHSKPLRQHVFGATKVVQKKNGEKGRREQVNEWTAPLRGVDRVSGG